MSEMSEKIIIKKQNGIYVLPIKDIIIMQKVLRKIRVYTDRGQLEFYGKFEELESSLDKRFMRCHRSYVINMDRIVIMTDERIFINGIPPITLGRDTYCKAKKVFDAYLTKKFG